VNTAEAQTTAAAAIAATSVALAVGRLAKGLDRFPDQFIPALCCVVGMIVVPSLAGWHATNVIAGFSAGFTATGMNQQYRQFFRKNDTQPPKKKDSNETP